MKITGRPTAVSLEFVRAWLHASLCVLAFHKRPVNETGLRVRILDLSKRVNRVTGGGVGGTACRAVSGETVVGTIELERTSKPDSMASIILHEVIHIACGDLGDHDNEHLCSTLTAKLKPEVAPLAQALLDGTYRRAAYLAHSKLSYKLPEGEGDRYNRAQWVKVRPQDPYAKKGGGA